LASAVVLLRFAMIHPATGAGQSSAIPNPVSGEKQNADEIPVPHEQSQTLGDVVAMIQDHEDSRAEKRLRDALLLHPDVAESHFLLGYTLCKSFRGSHRQFRSMSEASPA
jgi:hypothetical protein